MSLLRGLPADAVTWAVVQSEGGEAPRASRAPKVDRQAMREFAATHGGRVVTRGG